MLRHASPRPVPNSTADQPRHVGAHEARAEPGCEQHGQPPLRLQRHRPLLRALRGGPQAAPGRALLAARTLVSALVVFLAILFVTAFHLVLLGALPIVLGFELGLLIVALLLRLVIGGLGHGILLWFLCERPRYPARASGSVRQAT